MRFGNVNIPSGTLHSGPSVITAGAPLSDATMALIMVHGRGATSESILEIVRYLPVQDTAVLAPQATNNTWYPLSLLAPVERNEPWLSSALQRISEVVEYVRSSGIPEERIMLLGFSQGASLSLEWAARNARPIGAVFALSGGIIGPPGSVRTVAGTIPGTAVFIGCSDVDPHIPKERIGESAAHFRSMDAQVTERLYPGMPHTVNEDELRFIAAFLDQKRKSVSRQ